MANRSYLCCCDHHDIYPSLGYSDFDPKLHTLAAGIYAVPITWLAMFRQESLVTRNFDVDGEDIVVTAPISSRELCLDQLEQGIQRIEELFGWPGKLADYASCLRELLQNISGEYVTIELDEIAYMTEGREDFTQHLKNIFLCLDGIILPSATHDFWCMGGIDPKLPVYPPRGIYNRTDLTKEDFVQAGCLIGTDHMRRFPGQGKQIIHSRGKANLYQAYMGFLSTFKIGLIVLGPPPVCVYD